MADKARRLASSVNERLKDVVIMVDEPMEGWQRWETHISAPRQGEDEIVDYVSYNFSGLIEEKGVIKVSRVKCEHKDEIYRFYMRMCMTPSSNL